MRQVSEIFTAQDEVVVNNTLVALDSRYIIIDHKTLPLLRGMADLVTGQPDWLYEVYYRQIGEMIIPVELYYPAYYQTLAVRLYFFDASRVAASKPMVVSYVEKKNSKGQTYKFVDKLRSFSSHQEAVDFIARQEIGNYRLVSVDPFTSPIDIAPLDGFRLIYQSEDTVLRSGLTATSWPADTVNLRAGQVSPKPEEVISTIKIFEFTE